MGAALKIGLPSSFTACIVLGAVSGVVLGDMAFPSVEATFGEPIDDFLFGIGGAFFAGLAHEIVISFFRSN